MAIQKQFSIFIFALFLINLNAYANTPVDCAALLEKAGIARDAGDTNLAIGLEEHPFLNLVLPDASLNLLSRSPMNTMSAAQRILAIIKSYGFNDVPNPAGMGSIRRYNLFSNGLKDAKGKYLRIVGHEQAIEAVVSQLETMARGEPTYPVLLVGVPGTGKTMFMEVLREALLQRTTSDTQFATHTYAWQGLDKIPSLNEYTQEGERCPIHDSPFVLLPQPFQAAVLEKLVGDPVQKLVGVKPQPKKEMCPRCAHIQKEIVRHYSRETGRALTAAEIVEKLNDHVVVKRLVLGGLGTSPIIPRQADDADIGGLFMAKDPFALSLGPDHPFYYRINGAISGGNGSALFLDEALKQPKQLLDLLLTLIQGSRVKIGGAPELPLDTVIMIGTNTADLVEHLAQNPQSPLVDRVKRTPMNHPIAPDKIIEITAVSLPGLSMKPLRSAVDTKPVLVNEAPGQLFSTVGKFEAPDKRYFLQVGEGEDRVHISPEALSFLSQVVALSRMSFDPEAAKKAAGVKPGENWPLLEAPIFRDPILRLKAIMGLTPITPSQAMELAKLSQLLDEGTFGISARKVDDWLKDAIAEARKKENGNCVTPLLLKQVLDKMILEKAFGSDPQQLVTIARIARIIADHFTVPALKNALYEALALSKDNTLEQVYEEIIDEMIALSTDLQATHYRNEVTGQNVSIKRARLAEIEGIYVRETGRPLAFTEIAQFHLGRRRFQDGASSGATSSVRHENLMSAIVRWHVSKQAELFGTTFGKVLKIGTQQAQATADERELFSGFMRTLQDSRGFCPVCAAKAMEMISEDPGVVRTSSSGE